MCDNEAFEFKEVVTPAEYSASQEEQQQPATAREVTIDMQLTDVKENFNKSTAAGVTVTGHGKVQVLSVRDLCSRGILDPQQTSLTTVQQPPTQLTQMKQLTQTAVLAAAPVQIRCASAAAPVAATSNTVAPPSAASRKVVSAKAGSRTSAADPETGAGPASSSTSSTGGLASQLAAVLGRGPTRLSFMDRARAYRQHHCPLPDDPRVFGQLLEPSPYCHGIPDAESPDPTTTSTTKTICAATAANVLLSIEQLHNLMAERRHLVAIVDCREESETSRLDLTHLVSFSVSDILEADSLQLERLSKGHRYLILVSSLTTGCPREALLLLRDQLMRHLKLCCNSCCLAIHVLDCDVNLATYLGGNNPMPTVFEDCVYLIQEQHFALTAESLSLYQSVLTDSKTVEKFCHFQLASRRLACLRLASFSEDVEAALWLMKHTEDKGECVLLCFSSVAVGKALVVAYTMWKHRHLLRDAVRRVRDAWTVVELDATREKELLDVERRLFCPT